MPLAEIIDRDQRLRILQVLAQDRGHSHNAHILRSALAALGHDIRVDQVAALASWLAEAGLVEIAGEGSPLVVRLTERGLDVAQGRAVVPGVALRL